MHHHDATQPWMSPTSIDNQDPILVAADPGVWKTPNFLNEAEPVGSCRQDWQQVCSFRAMCW
jgi:hypothetical protein